jgi:demethylmenaquinone methyltransferase/2-methoxy-6-polyprenyl-1,4-benzoquinol methylase
MPAVTYARSAAPAPVAGGRLPPHPLLGEYYADEAGRLKQVRRWFDASAGDYDWVNRLMSLGSGEHYRAEALRRFGLGPGERLLDAGAGTGVIAALAQKLAGPEGLVVALDPSSGMLRQAAARGVRHRVPGRAEHLPFADASFDRLTMGYALRHVADLGATFGEYARVLAPGGSLLLLEITCPRGRLGREMLRFYMRTLVPLAARWLRQRRDTATLMRYYWDTIESCVPPETILAALRAAGFEKVQRRAKLGVFSEYTAVKPSKSCNTTRSSNEG